MYAQSAALCAVNALTAVIMPLTAEKSTSASPSSTAPSPTERTVPKVTAQGGESGGAGGGAEANADGEMEERRSRGGQSSFLDFVAQAQQRTPLLQYNDHLISGPRVTEVTMGIS